MRVCYFSDHFDSPDKLVGELRKVIEETRKEAATDKVNLVCHSMGGLVARKYLADNFGNHHVSKMILVGTPNKGSTALTYNWGPIALTLLGFGSFAVTGNPLFLSFTASGIACDAASYYFGGVKLSSPAVAAMKPGSKFLTELDKKATPPDVEYIVILSNADDSTSMFFNRTLGYDGGDGAISLYSQSLRDCGMPNFGELNYKELNIKSPHFKEPTGAKDAIVKALGL